MDDEIKLLIAPHKEAIFFWKAFGSWPGGDAMEVKRVAEMIDPNISGCCLGPWLETIFNHMDLKEFNEYKIRKGI